MMLRSALFVTVLASQAHAGSMIGVYANQNGRASLADVEAFDAGIGQKVAIDNSYYYFNAIDLARATADISYGVTPMLSIDACTASGSVLYSDIAANVYDTQLTAQAEAIAALGSPVYLRYFYEMTNFSCDYGDANPEETPDAFLAAWQHIVTLIRGIAPNAYFVWSPGEPLFTSGDWQAWYPGDAYVDIAAEDVYNKQPVDPSSISATFPGEICGTTIDVPEMIAETGAIGTRNQLAWFGSVATACPDLSYFVPFDSAGRGGIDYVISDPGVYAAIAAIAE